jgi:pimeloyl-ACP methyl ester carboxylesterase
MNIIDLGGLLAVAVALAAPQRMETVTLNGITLEYEIRGSDEPVVLIHAGVLADFFKPLMTQAALTGRYRVLRYHRAGYAGSTNLAGSVSIGDHARHLRELLGHLKIARAHVVGHSSSGNIALQLALDAPEMVQSLAILEPALRVEKASPERAGAVKPVIEAYRAGDKAAALDGCLRMVAGPGYRAVVDRALPGAFDQAIADADAFFGQEFPAIQRWPFDREIASRIKQPVLAVTGEKSADVSAVWPERQAMLLEWLPNAEPFVLSNAAHLLQLENPQGMAEGLAAFFAKHPIAKR